MATHQVITMITRHQIHSHDKTENNTVTQTNIALCLEGSLAKCLSISMIQAYKKRCSISIAFLFLNNDESFIRHPYPNEQNYRDNNEALQLTL